MGNAGGPKMHFQRLMRQRPLSRGEFVALLFLNTLFALDCEEVLLHQS